MCLPPEQICIDTFTDGDVDQRVKIIDGDIELLVEKLQCIRKVRAPASEQNLGRCAAAMLAAIVIRGA